MGLREMYRQRGTRRGICCTAMVYGHQYMYSIYTRTKEENFIL